MSNPSLVSVIIPCYNTAVYLAEAVDSALRQTYADFEVIVIDDGSTDNTSEVMARFSSDNRLCYHYQSNEGLSAARNKGIKLANGSFIALLDADDVWEKEKLAQQVAVLEKDASIGLVFSDFSSFDVNGIIASRKNSGCYNEGVDFERLFHRNNFIYPSTVLIRQEVFESCGLFDTKLRSAEDYDMWLRIAKTYRIVGIDAALVRIRQHGANMSSNVLRMLENEIAVIDKYQAELPLSSWRRRLAKIYYINADRLAYMGRRSEAVRLLAKGLTTSVIMVDTLVVVLKLMVGGRGIDFLRRKINDGNNPLAKIYWEIYSRY